MAAVAVKTAISMMSVPSAKVLGRCWQRRPLKNVLSALATDPDRLATATFMIAALFAKDPVGPTFLRVRSSTYNPNYFLAIRKDGSPRLLFTPRGITVE